MRKASKCPANNKKMGKEAERRGKERKQKVKVETAMSLSKHKNSSKILLSTHAQTSEADILNL